MELKFPLHECSLSLDHNPHKDLYQTVREWLADTGPEFEPTWPSPSERELAISTDEIWILQWYPKTPVGFCCVAAASLTEVLRAAQ